MKKLLIFILFMFILCSACKNNSNNAEKLNLPKTDSNSYSNTFNIKKLDLPKNDIIFNISKKDIDIFNAGTNKYNKQLTYSFLLDVEKEDFAEKYFPKFYKLDVDYRLNEPQEHPSNIFLQQGSSLSEAYKHIMYIIQNKKATLNSTNFGYYCFQTNKLFVLNQVNFSDASCYSAYSVYINLYRNINLSLLKARNMILHAIDNDLKYEKNKIIAQAHLMVALSYFAQDELYNIDMIKKHAGLWKELGGKNIEFFDKNTNKKLNSLLTYVAYNDNTGIVEILQDSKSKDFIDIILSEGGVYNYLNDGDYIPVATVERGDKYAMNPFFMEYMYPYNTADIMAKIIPSKKEKNNALYNIQNNYDTLYDNPVYIVAIGGTVYTVEMKNNAPYKVEYRNPSYFDTSYDVQSNNEKASYYDNFVIPPILNEYNYNYIQKDYAIFENGKANIIWKGDVRDQRPDIRKQFKLYSAVDCLKDTGDIAKYCGNREAMIVSMYIFYDSMYKLVKGYNQKKYANKSEEIQQYLDNVKKASKGSIN